MRTLTPSRIDNVSQTQEGTDRLALMHYARILRSKNAGAFTLTIDVLFKSREDFEYVLRSGALDEQIVANLYGVNAQDVSIIPYTQVQAIKVTMPRLIGSGDLADSDVYGSQQHVPLLYLPIPAHD